MHFITQATPGIWRKFQKLEAGPQNPQSTFLVEEAFRVSNNQDLMAETNEDRRLVKRMQLLTALISYHLKETLESKQDSPPRSRLGPNHCAYCQREGHWQGHWQGECPEHPPLGCPRENPNMPSVQFSCSVMSDFLQPHESQNAKPPCPSPTPRVHSDSRPSSQ